MTDAALSPRAARTRAALIAAGFDLLAERPIDAIPIDAVVVAAGVAKGSFFNHFADKQAFAAALANEVRGEIEERVGRYNQGVEDPVQRIAGGLRAAVAYAVQNRKRVAALLRSSASLTDPGHPLNKGVIDDLDRARRAGLLRAEAATSGVLYWLGVCQALIGWIVQQPSDSAAIASRTREMIVLGLTGLGVVQARAEDVADLP